ncbi:hypothetical protein ACX0G9_30080 [Flavitalea flava]
MHLPPLTLSTTHTVLTQQVIEDIIALDRSNMAPLLQRNGQQFNEDFVRMDIFNYHPDLQHVVCCYDNHILQGYFRYSLEEPGHVLIRSFQLNKTAPKITLLRLLVRAYDLLQTETALHPDHTEVYAISNLFNTHSIRFQQKLGFSFYGEDGSYCRLQTTTAALLKRLWLLNRGQLSFQQAVTTADEKQVA